LALRLLTAFEDPTSSMTTPCFGSCSDIVGCIWRFSFQLQDDNLLSWISTFTLKDSPKRKQPYACWQRDGLKEAKVKLKVSKK
jgi:hypothetical protein